MTEQQQRPVLPEDEHRPRMQPTRSSTLVISYLAALAVAWLLISRFYAEIPRLPWAPAACAAVLAVIEGYCAVQTRARVERRPGREPVAPLVVARFVVLAKASAVTGAIFAGAYSGALSWLGLEQLRLGPTAARTDDLPMAAVGAVVSVALMLSAIWLERACRVPPSDDDRDLPPLP